ncbi:Ldh family oxidoreductase [Pseudactinotalea sp. Z1748]|uniref:Ldh family oxidoreductase n=1 Tax=Pseudactinotalea sp. Z1748 TaxID=3413027 RepID=UPI003C7D17DF
MSRVRLDVDHARDVAAALLRGAGVPDDDAHLTADCLVYADRRGTASHGLLRLPLYLSALVAGGINPRPQVRWLNSHPGGGLLHADGALGQVAMGQAVEFVAERIEASPVVAVVVQDSTHYGAGAYWSDLIADLGCVALITSTTGPVATPHGAHRTILGSNPLTIVLPAGTEGHLTADIATSAGAYGKVVEAANAGEQIPPGWAVDSAGRPTTDPDQALRGALIAMGGHKGSALMVALEGLSAALGSAAYAFETEDIWVNPASRMNVGHTLIALNPAFFGGTDHTAARVETLRQAVRDAGEPGAVHAPGDIELARAARNTRTIEVAESTVTAVNDLALAHHTPLLRPDNQPGDGPAS